jgi:uncharacterized integral membrane protein
MWGILKALFLAPIAVLVIFFAVANRHLVTISLDPIAHDPAFSLTVPFFVAFFVILIVGIAIGYGAAWWAQGVHRKAERRLQRECDRLNNECRTLKTQMPAEQAALLVSR